VGNINGIGYFKLCQVQELYTLGTGGNKTIGPNHNEDEMGPVQEGLVQEKRQTGWDSLFEKLLHLERISTEARCGIYQVFSPVTLDTAI
jgi:hypothetical protein